MSRNQKTIKGNVGDMVKIGIDLLGAEPASNGVKNHGGGEYVKIVFDYLYKHNLNNELYVITSGNDLDIINFLKEYPKITILKTKNDTFENLLTRNNINIVFSGLYVKQFDSSKFPKNVKLILTEHGLRGIETNFDRYFIKTEKKKMKNIIKFLFSRLFPKLYLKYKVNLYLPEFKITKNLNVITVSNHSQYSIKYYYPFVKDILVAYSPLKLSEATFDESMLNKYSLEKNKYILMINANRGEKNCLRAIEALDELYGKKLISSDIKVVLTGVTYAKPFRKYKNVPLISMGYIKSNLLETLYANAHLFLYPTINEGFGYPPLEAMKYHTFVAASAICSIPEVCGNAVLYFNPYDIKEIQNRILQSFNEEIRNYYIEKMDQQLNYIKSKQNTGLKNLCKLIYGDNYEKNNNI